MFRDHLAVVKVNGDDLQEVIEILKSVEPRSFELVELGEPGRDDNADGLRDILVSLEL